MGSHTVSPSFFTGGDLNGELDALGIIFRRYVAVVLIFGECLLQYIAELHLCPCSTRFYICQHALECGHIAGDLTHFAEWLVNTFELLTDDLKLLSRRLESVSVNFSSTVMRICSSFFSLFSCRAVKLFVSVSLICSFCRALTRAFAQVFSQCFPAKLLGFVLRRCLFFHSAPY